MSPRLSRTSSFLPHPKLESLIPSIGAGVISFRRDGLTHEIRDFSEPRQLGDARPNSISCQTEEASWTENGGHEQTANAKNRPVYEPPSLLPRDRSKRRSKRRRGQLHSEPIGNRLNAINVIKPISHPRFFFPTTPGLFLIDERGFCIDCLGGRISENRPVLLF